MQMHLDNKRVAKWIHFQEFQFLATRIQTKQNQWIHY